MFDDSQQARISAFLCQSVHNVGMLRDVELLLEPGALFCDPSYTDDNCHLPEGRLEALTDADYRAGGLDVVLKGLQGEWTKTRLGVNHTPPFRIFISKQAQIRMALIHALTLRDFEYSWYLVGRKDESGNIYVFDARLNANTVHVSKGDFTTVRGGILPEDAQSSWFRGLGNQEQGNAVSIDMHTHHLLTVHASPADWRRKCTFGVTTRFGEIRFYHRDKQGDGEEVLYPIVPVTMEAEPSSLSLVELEVMARELGYLTPKYTAYFGNESLEVQVLTWVRNLNNPPHPKLLETLKANPFLFAPQNPLGLSERTWVVRGSDGLGLADTSFWSEEAFANWMRNTASSLGMEVLGRSECPVSVRISLQAGLRLSMLVALLPGHRGEVNQLPIKTVWRQLGASLIELKDIELFSAYDDCPIHDLKPWSDDPDFAISDESNGPALTPRPPGAKAVGWYCLDNTYLGGFDTDGNRYTPHGRDWLSYVLAEVGNRASLDLPEVEAIPILVFDKGGRFRVFATSNYTHGDSNSRTFYTNVSVIMEESSLPSDQVLMEMLDSLRDELVALDILQPAVPENLRWVLNVPGYRQLSSFAPTRDLN